MSVGFLVSLIVGPLLLALTAYLALEASAGRIERNRAIGIRLRSTMRSDAAWRAGHRAAVRPTVVALVLVVLLDGLALALRAVGVAVPALTLGLAVALVLAVVVIADAAGRAARATARSAR